MKIRVFDNPAFADRYTIVFIEDKEPHLFLSMNANPLCFQQGVCEEGEVWNEWLEDNEEFEITFDTLPAPCKQLIIMEFSDLSDAVH